MIYGLRKRLSVMFVSTLLLAAPVCAETYYSLEIDRAKLIPKGIAEDGRGYTVTREGGGAAPKIVKDPRAGSTVLVLRTASTPKGSAKDRAEIRIYSGITFDRPWFLGMRILARGPVEPDAWHLLMQCHQTGTQTSPPLSLNLEAGNKIALIARSTEDKYEKLWSGYMPQARWTDIVLGFQMGAKGRVQLWINGKRVADNKLPLRWVGFEERCVLKAGIYRSATGTPFEMRFDDIRLGDSYLDVAR